MFEVIERKCSYNPKSGVIVDTLENKVLYSTSTKLLILPSEEVGRPNNLVQCIIFRPGACWEWPYNNQPILEEDRERIKADVREAFSVLTPSIRIEFKDDFY